MQDLKHERQKVNCLLKGVLRTERTIIPEQNLVEDLGFSSLNMMEFISVIEDEYEVVIPLNKIMHIKTVDQLYYAIEHLDDLSNN